MAVESNVYALWAAGQTAKGTAGAIASAKRMIQVAGDVDLNREDGSENFSDLDRFGDASDYVDTIAGAGNPTIQAQANSTAYLCWLFFGAEVFTAKSAGVTPPKFVFQPGATTGLWSTWWKRVGLTNIFRQKFSDSKIASLRFEGSTANKIVKVIPTFTSLDPGEVFAVDPVGAIDAADPFLYTDGEGAFTIDGTIYRGHSQFAFTIDDGQAPYQGDSVLYQDMIAGNANITLEGVTILLDAAGLANYNTQIYGTPTPAAGTKPLKTIPALGSYSILLSRGLLDAKISFKAEFAGVKWSPDVAVAPNPDGGAIEIPLGGQMRKVVGQPGIKITVETGAGDNLAHVAS